jgi:CDP-glucose 4,6-dehydratase
MSAQFWANKRVLITGHTGFKGSWLALWLQKLGAIVAGYALPAAEESLFRLADVEEGMLSASGDIRNAAELRGFFGSFRPEIVFHLAAQSLVRTSYETPVETYEVNVMGTLQLLEAVRKTPSCRVTVVVTSDKCYLNRERIWGYREDDALGGRDPYSSSKACAELVTLAYQASFFAKDARVAVATVRAGNVIGGGDFARDRLVPDIMKSLRMGEPLQVRNPDAIRPWQHVLDPLSGYLLLAEKMWNGESTAALAEAWNFGPAMDDARPVRWIVARLATYWGAPLPWVQDQAPHPHEAGLLTLDSTKARSRLGWRPRWTLEDALIAICEWHKACARGESMRQVVMQQIAAHEAAKPES